MQNDPQSEFLDLTVGLAEQGMTPARKAHIETLVAEYKALELRIEKGEQLLAELKARTTEILTKELVKELQQCGLNLIGTDDGMIARLHTIVSGSLPKDEDKRKDAIKYLVKIGGKALISTEINYSFEKGEEALVKAFERHVKGFNQPLNSTSKSGVHPQTLAAFVREKLEKNQPVDPELLGVFVGQTVKIEVDKKLAKKAKASKEKKS